jgi:hypothetical protein
LLGLLGEFTDGIGGLGGVISGLGLIVTKVFSKQIAQGFRDMANNMVAGSEVGMKIIQEQKANEMQKMKDLMATSDASS